MRKIVLWTVVIMMVAGGGAAGYSHWRSAGQGAGESGYRTVKIERRRHQVHHQIERHGSTGLKRAGGCGRVRAHLPGLRRLQRQGQEGATPGGGQPPAFKANVDQAVASLACNQASLLQAEAKLEQAKREWKRAQGLLPQKAIADTDYDIDKSNYDAAVANVALCKAQIQQSQGVLDLAQTNLKYTRITSPVDGIVTDRKVDPGQSLASAYQTPVLFVVAPDLEKRVYVLASVDEADIGLIRDAKARKQPVTFAVEAYPRINSRGRSARCVLRPRRSRTSSPIRWWSRPANLQLKLLPGMTPTLTFQIETRAKVLRVPQRGAAVSSQAGAGPAWRPGHSGRQGCRLPGKAGRRFVEGRHRRRRRGDAGVGPEAAICLGCRRRFAVGRENRHRLERREIHGSPCRRAPPGPVGGYGNETSLAPGYFPQGRRYGQIPMDLLLIVRVAFRALAKNKLRAGLTVLGIVIGVAAVILLVSISQSAGRMVDEKFEELGTNVISVTPATARRAGSGWAAKTAITLTFDARRRLAECPAPWRHRPGCGPPAFRWLRETRIGRPTRSSASTPPI